MLGYVSYICSDNFIPGVIALNNSIKQHGHVHNLMVMVTDNISLSSVNTLKDNDILTRQVPRISYNGQRKDQILDRYGKSDTSWKMFTKLNAWKQTDYSKLIYLDADTLVLKNIDILFSVDELGAVLGGSEILQYNGIEAGVLVLEPNENMYKDMIDRLRSDKYDIKMSDQSFLNDYFTKHGKINYIPETFNRRWKKNRDTGSCHIFHFNANKPWIDPERLDKNSVNIWKKYYEENNH